MSSGLTKTSPFPMTASVARRLQFLAIIGSAIAHLADLKVDLRDSQGVSDSLSHSVSHLKHAVVHGGAQIKASDVEAIRRCQGADCGRRGVRDLEADLSSPMGIFVEDKLDIENFTYDII